MRQEALNDCEEKGSIGFKHHADVRRNPWKQSKIHNSTFYCDVTAFSADIKYEANDFKWTKPKRALSLSSYEAAAGRIALHKQQICSN